MPYQSTPEDRQWGYALGIIYLFLATVLAVMLFKIWPPTPWPKDVDLNQDEVLAKNLGYCECLPPPSPSPSVSPTPAAASAVLPAASRAASPASAAALSPAASPSPSVAASPAASPSVSPTPSPTPKTSDALANMPITFFGKSLCTSFDERLILLVIVAGMLGAFVHGSTSLADYLGNDRFGKSWTWFYLLRPVIGMALALVFYFVIRGGFLTTSGGAKDINPYGIAALAGMVGMFSKQATDKLGEVFGTLFRSAAGQGDDQRDDPLKPKTDSVTIEKIDPTQVVAGTTGVSIKVTGANFAATAKVWLDKKPQPTTFESETSLVAKVTDDLTSAPATYKLTVVNSNEVESPPVEFKVVAPDASGAASETAAEPVQGEGGDDDFVDGCDVEFEADTSDEALPITEGGVK